MSGADPFTDDLLRFEALTDAASAQPQLSEILAALGESPALIQDIALIYSRLIMPRLAAHWANARLLVAWKIITSSRAPQPLIVCLEVATDRRTPVYATAPRVAWLESLHLAAWHLTDALS